MARRSYPSICLSLGMLALLPAVPALSADTAPAEDSQSTQSLPSIVVTEARSQPIVERALATGTVQAREEVYVAPLIDGLSIRTLDADVGDRVEAGQALATLNDDTLLLEKSQLNASLAKATAALAQIKAQLVEAEATAAEAVTARDRAVKLSKNGSQSQAVADQAIANAATAAARVSSAEQAIEVAQADIKVAESQIADIDLRLARTAVKSPVSGLVAARTAKIGAIAAGAGEPLFTIIRDGEIELKADVSEDSILKLAAGQKATITLGGGVATLGGEVRLVEPTLDPNTRLGRIYIRFDEPEKARAGMFASASIVTAEKTGIVLPLSAVTTANGKSQVRKVSDAVVTLVEVKTGIQDGQVLEIEEGLSAGDLVVAKAGAYVRDGDRINPVEAEAAAAN